MKEKLSNPQTGAQAIKTPYFKSDIDETLKNEIGGKIVQAIKNITGEYPGLEIVVQINLMARKKKV